MTSRRGWTASPTNGEQVGAVPGLPMAGRRRMLPTGPNKFMPNTATVAWRKWTAQSPSPPLVAASALIINHCGRHHLWLLRPASDVRLGTTGTEKHRVSSSASHRIHIADAPRSSHLLLGFAPPTYTNHPPPSHGCCGASRIEQKPLRVYAVCSPLPPPPPSLSLSLLSVSVGLWTLRLSG